MSTLSTDNIVSQSVGHLDALEDGGVLAVGGQDVDAVFSGQRQHEGAARDERLLVGQAYVLLGLDGRHGGQQASAADDACGENQSHAAGNHVCTWTMDTKSPNPRVGLLDKA